MAAGALNAEEGNSTTLEGTSSCVTSGCTAGSGSASSDDPMGAVAKKGSSVSSNAAIAPLEDGNSLTTSSSGSVGGGSSLTIPACTSAGEGSSVTKSARSSEDVSIGLGKGKSVDGSS